MNVLGIITEYNPFHNGHLYHLNQSKKNSGAEIVVCVMNGNFTQRGEPAVTDKWSRTRMALNNGVDIVLELPLIYGIRSAEFFAEGTVKTLQATGVVDTLVFGSESGKLQPLSQIADILTKEPPYFKKKLKEYLKEGLSFPSARELALKDYKMLSNKPVPIEVLNSANDILGIEYLKVLKKYNIPIKPDTILRKGEAYHSQNIDSSYASATAIRNMINNIDQLQGLVPETCRDILEQEIKSDKIPVNKNYLGIMILSKLREKTPAELLNYPDIANGLEQRIINASYKSGDLISLIKNIKTKAYTWTRIQRSLLHILFELETDVFKYFDQQGLQYLRVLGFTEKGETILGEIKKKSPLPLITSPADYIKQKQLQSSDPLNKMLSYDLLATDIYSLLYRNKKYREGHQDYYREIIKI